LRGTGSSLCSFLHPDRFSHDLHEVFTKTHTGSWHYLIK
jgi:hypothetical protein